MRLPVDMNGAANVSPQLVGMLRKDMFKFVFCVYHIKVFRAVVSSLFNVNLPLSPDKTASTANPH